MFRSVIVPVIVFFLISTLQIPVDAQISGEGNLDDDTFIISCDDGTEVIGGLKFTFINIIAGFTYRITAVGIDDFDPVLTVVTAPGTGDCNDDFEMAQGSQVPIPDIGMIRGDEHTAQVTIRTTRTANIDVVVGGYQGASGRFAMIIEGLAISPNDEKDGFLISVPSAVASQPLEVYMVSRTGSLDAYLQLIGGEGIQQTELDFSNATELDSCNNLSLNDCSDVPRLPGTLVKVTGHDFYQVSYGDAGIISTPGSTDKFMYIFGSNNERTGGDYAILIIGNAPGDLGVSAAGDSDRAISGAAGCDSIPATVHTATSEFNQLYTASNLLDSDPDTAWSSADTADEYIMFELDGTHKVGEIRLNTFPPSGRKQDAIQRFRVMVMDSATSTPTTVLETRADRLKQAGFQSFSFAPVETSLIGIEFLSNYGGSSYELADILFCSAP